MSPGWKCARISHLRHACYMSRWSQPPRCDHPPAVQYDVSVTGGMCLNHNASSSSQISNLCPAPSHDPLRFLCLWTKSRVRSCGLTGHATFSGHCKRSQLDTAQLIGWGEDHFVVSVCMNGVPRDRHTELSRLCYATQMFIIKYQAPPPPHMLPLVVGESTQHFSKAQWIFLD
jgi:hypothetical protein